MEKIRLEQQKLEQEVRLELELKRLESETHLKELEIQAKYKSESDSASSSSAHRSQPYFDASRYIKLVPKFTEIEVDKYFQHFEKVAANMKWPKEVWTLLLQSSFVGKAREVYSALPMEKSENYDEVKQAILKAYELVPEAYRQKFRGARKNDNQTHVEFARIKEQMFDRWLHSKDVGENFVKLRQLFLIEEFKRCIHPDIKTHIDERMIDTLHAAATKADDYALTHKLSPNKFYQARSQKPKINTEVKGTPDSKGNSGKWNSGGTKPPSGSGFKKQVTCYNCNKPGHLMSQCYLLQNQNSQRKQEGSSKSPPNTVGCVASERNSNRINKEIQKKKFAKNPVNKEFQPFVMEGRISISDDFSPQQIKIVRDTCCSQSLILEETLPFGEQSSTGTCALIRGINMEIISVPLHRVNLECGLVSGQVLVGVMSELPIKGVSMMLGNDLAGDKVLPNPIVTYTPSNVSSHEEDEIYPACVMTRAMSKKAVSEVEESESCQGDVFKLEDTFFKVLNDTESSSGDNQKVEKEDPLSRNKLILEQSRDPELIDLVKGAVTPQEAEDNPVCFYKQNGVVMRKWRPLDAPADEEWQVVHQTVVPKVYHSDIMSMAHDSPMAGHLGVRKTCDRILKHFWWPKIRSDVADYCRSCHTCQVVGKPNQKIPPAPLKPIPAFDEPFRRVIIDCFDSLPKTKSGRQNLEQGQAKMKQWYDKNAKNRVFKPGII
ncbi:uncharacterized protein [Apostichopus japonicus]|uniref:uncharacterized protein n=1 Tax=Stichopus japonicus TaxID=307972 RepID=UPI003AB2EDCE